MSVGLMLAGFLATASAGRVALASRDGAPSRRALAATLAAGAAVIAVGVVLADPFLDALDISPESFRIAAGLVLAAAGLRTIVRPEPSGPFAASLVTPELACLAISAGADEGIAAALGAGALALVVVAVTARALPAAVVGRATPFLAALQVVVGVALVVAGVRDV
jgi:hypothetical protein